MPKPLPTHADIELDVQYDKAYLYYLRAASRPGKPRGIFRKRRAPPGGKKRGVKINTGKEQLIGTLPAGISGFYPFQQLKDGRVGFNKMKR